MSQGERSSSSEESEKALFAAFVTLVVATGSAFVWRSSVSKRPASALFSSGSTVSHSSNPPPTTNCEPTYAHSTFGLDDGGTSDAGKQARSKERRRRGKDPLKELIKAERKGKS